MTIIKFTEKKLKLWGTKMDMQMPTLTRAPISSTTMT
jgi:hypothetical protein